MTSFKIPHFTLPAAFARLGPKLPQLPPTLALVAALNAALGRVLPRDALEPLLGKRFCIKVLDAGMTLRFTYGHRGFRPIFDAAPADLVMSSKSRDYLALLLREEDPDTLFFSRRLLMEGDTELGLLMKNTLDGIEMPRLDPRALAANLAPAQVLRSLAAHLATLRHRGA
ncbi:MAG: sterol-binding protein [Rhodocyclaceae bacterium]|nr:sterol-binding protein [Rhodocyclaceae bacterium]